MYKIKVYYKTGDSFSTRDTHTVLETTWKNLDIAKENLQRIKEHYELEREYNKICYNKDAEDSFIAKGLPSFIKVEKRHHLLCMKLRLDNDKEVQFFPGWCGYFEQLQWAEIIADQDSGMYFEI